jgi:peptidoglycan-associated lipoprotein
MRNSTVVSFLLTLGLAGCAHDRPAHKTLPPPPDFEASTATTPARSDTPASTGRAQQIAPEDQVLFALDSTTLEPTATPVLDDIATWVKADPSHTILIRGHADASGSTEHNFELSARRAQAVASYLYDRASRRSR